MPAEYRIDRVNRIVLSRAWGQTSIEDFKAHGMRLLADPDFSPDFRQFWDFTAISESLTDFDSVAKLAQVNVFSHTSRRAFLAPADVTFGVGRMFQMLRESKGETGIRIFRDRDAAMSWLETGEEPPPEPRVNSANPLRKPAMRG